MYLDVLFMLGCQFALLECLLAWCLDVMSGINVVIFDKWLSKQASQLQFL